MKALSHYPSKFGFLEDKLMIITCDQSYSTATTAADHKHLFSFYFISGNDRNASYPLNLFNPYTSPRDMYDS